MMASFGFSLTYLYLCKQKAVFRPAAGTQQWVREESPGSTGRSTGENASSR